MNPVHYGAGLTYPSLFDSYPMENQPPPQYPMGNHPQQQNFMGNHPPQQHPMGNHPPQQYPMGNHPQQQYPMGNHLPHNNAYSYQSWNTQLGNQGQNYYYQANMGAPITPNPIPNHPQVWNERKRNNGRNNYYNNKRTKKEPEFVDFCDVCDRGFKTEEKKLEHYSQHVTCKEPGCSFEAHFKIVEIHRRNLHGPNGHRIKLETPEDILKWREDRKKNFPTSERIEAKALQEEQRKASGAVLKPQSFGKFKSRNNGRKWKKQRNFQKPQDNNNTENVTTETRELNVNRLPDMNETKDNVESCTKNGSIGSNLSCTPKNSGGAMNLLVGYGSNSDNEDNPNDPSNPHPKNTSENLDQGASISPNIPEENCSKDKNKRQKNQRKKGVTSQQHMTRKTRLSKPTLLRMLLEPEIRKERNEILQCIRHIVRNDFFDEQPKTN